MDSESGDRDNSLPSWLKRRRTELRIGKAEAARRASVGRMAWYEWEAGRRLPYDTNYAGIEEAMQWEPGSVDALISHGTPPQPLTVDPAVAEIAARMFAAIDGQFKTWGVEMSPRMLEIWHDELTRQLAIKRRQQGSTTDRDHSYEDG